MAPRVALALCLLLVATAASAQVRGVYPTGMNAVNAGMLPASGWSYSNLLILNSRDERRGPAGETLATGEQAVALDLNTFAWASQVRPEGGPRFAAAATVILSRNSLTSDTAGDLGGGGGFGDFFVQPLIVGWSGERFDVKAAYGFVAPTGRFEAGAGDNVGAGYWTHALSSGATVALDDAKATKASAFVMYEWHGRQEGTEVKPGDTLNVDASVMRALDTGPERRCEVGIAGYAQRQVSAKAGPGVTPDAAAERYRVRALGVAGQLAWPARRSGLAMRLFGEFDARSTFQGLSVQLSGSIAF